MGMLRNGIELVFKRREFGLLMGAQFAAQAGDGIVQTALAKLIVFGGQRGFDLEAARSPDELLRIALLVFVPYTIVSPFLGVVIDRWDRRLLLAAANGVRALALLSIALIGTQNVGEVPLFLVFLLTLASTRVVLATKAAALPAALGDRSLVEGNAVSQFGGALCQLGGAGAALVAAGLFDVEPIVLAGVLVYMVGALSALLITRAGEARSVRRFMDELAHVLRSIADGLREVAAKPKAAASITTYFWLRFLWSFAIVGIGFLARELLAGDDTVALLMTGGAGAIGAALGFVLADRLHERARSSAHLVLSTSSVAGAAVALLGAVEATAALAAMTFLLGFGFFLGKISLDTMVQESLDDGFRGRAFSLYDIAYNLAWVVAAALMKGFWTPEVQGLLIAASGLVFLAGLFALGLWYRRAGLLTLGAVAGAPR